jgi:hypothetical protein
VHFQIFLISVSILTSHPSLLQLPRPVLPIIFPLSCLPLPVPQELSQLPFTLMRHEGKMEGTSLPWRSTPPRLCWRGNSGLVERESREKDVVDRSQWAMMLVRRWKTIVFERFLHRRERWSTDTLHTSRTAWSTLI